MARVLAGNVNVLVTDVQADTYRNLFDLLAITGKSRMVPFPGENDDGDATTVWVMCGPGAALTVVEDHVFEGSLDLQLGALVDYLTSHVDGDADG